MGAKLGWIWGFRGRGGRAGQRFHGWRPVVSDRGVGVIVIQAVCSCGSPLKILAMTCGNSACEIIFLMPAGIDPKDV